MTKKLIFVFSHVLALFFNGFAQPIDHAWLETSQLKVRVNADGRLFCDDEKGAFLVPKGDSMVSLMRGAGMWFGGIDPGNNLLISAQTDDPVMTDLAAGLRGVPNSGKVWKVTQEEIEAHRQDYLDNWVIDNPIPSIFGFPALGNHFFYQYNGFSWPDSMSRFAFFDTGNGRYEPQNGEFPLLNVRALDGKWQIPAEMACFVAHPAVPQHLTNHPDPFPVQVWGQVFVYDCPQNELLTRSVFVHYYWRNEGEYRVDSSTVSVFNDIDLGDSEDDYHGFLPGRNAYYAYNSDSIDSHWGAETPLFFVKTADFPLEVYSNPWNNEYELTETSPTLMPFGTSIAGFGQSAPKYPHQFYNIMTGTWSDGTPLSIGGSGYNPGNPNTVKAESAFSGYPDTPDAWTELNAQNPAGNRRALLNFDIGTSLPKMINRMTFQYTYMPWEKGTLTERIHHWETAQEYLFDRLFCCTDFQTPIQAIGCEYEAPYRPEPEPWIVFPNPATEVIKVWHPGLYIQKMLLYDALGQVFGVGEHRGQYSEISVQNLPSGLYFLHIEDEKGEKRTVKVVVAHGQE